MQACKATPEVLFGKEIARLRRRVGISQEELGFRAEVHRTYVSQLERGLKSPTLSMMLKLSRALKASASRLVATVERQLWRSHDRLFLISWLPLPPLPRRHRLRIGPQAFPSLSCFLLQLFQHRISWRILPIPPAPALFDEFVVDVRAIG